MSDNLHIFRFGIGEELVSAHSVADAIRVVAEQRNEPGDLTEELPPDEWTQLADDEPLTINFEEADKPEPGDYPEGATLSEDGWKATAPAGAWAAMGREWIGSTEW